jgi:hypothetical protein
LSTRKVTPSRPGDEKADAPTFGSVRAVADLTGVSIKRVEDLVGAGRVRTARIRGASLVCLEDVTRRRDAGGPT